MVLEVSQAPEISKRESGVIPLPARGAICLRQLSVKGLGV